MRGSEWVQWKGQRAGRQVRVPTPALLSPFHSNVTWFDGQLGYTVELWGMTHCKVAASLCANMKKVIPFTRHFTYISWKTTLRSI